MEISHFNIGLLHSLIGKNDGVSIVIDQTVRSMVSDLNMELGNIFFLAAHSSPRFNAETDEIFWHKNEANKSIVRYFSQEAPEWLDGMIHENALRVKEIIGEFIRRHSIDLPIILLQQSDLDITLKRYGKKALFGQRSWYGGMIPILKGNSSATRTRLSVNT
jgi:hypothetical protein